MPWLFFHRGLLQRAQMDKSGGLSSSESKSMTSREALTGGWTMKNGDSTIENDGFIMKNGGSPLKTRELLWFVWFNQQVWFIHPKIWFKSLTWEVKHQPLGDLTKKCHIFWEEFRFPGGHKQQNWWVHPSRYWTWVEQQRLGNGINKGGDITKNNAGHGNPKCGWMDFFSVSNAPNFRSVIKLRMFTLVSPGFGAFLLRQPILGQIQPWAQHACNKGTAASSSGALSRQWQTQDPKSAIPRT